MGARHTQRPARLGCGRGSGSSGFPGVGRASEAEQPQGNGSLGPPGHGSSAQLQAVTAELWTMALIKQSGS